MWCSLLSTESQKGNGNSQDKELTNRTQTQACLPPKPRHSSLTLCIQDCEGLKQRQREKQPWCLHTVPKVIQKLQDINLEKASGDGISPSHRP